MVAPQLLCLLPVRNGAETLQSYLDSARGFADGVLALDDGSTDATRAMLEADPLVKAMLTNPPRPSYAGWDDARNRARLLEACADFAPRWVIWLDADERLADCDIPRLRTFLADEAEIDAAYGLEVLRMIGDDRHFDKNRLWTYRLFAYRDGYTLPTETLHFEPVPDQIPRVRWLRTRLRILHFAGIDDAARQQRFDKYREVDPTNRWQESYDDILEPPGEIWELRPLAAHQPLVLGKPAVR